MLDALAKKPHTLAELAAMPELFGEDVTSLAEVAAVPVMSEQGATYFPASAKMEPDATHRMNRALALQARHDDNYQVLASPLLGNGVTAGLVQRLVYLSLSRSRTRSMPMPSSGRRGRSWQRKACASRPKASRWKPKWPS
jgi:hypothetical protein